jgi:FkbM family methyltransferase
MLRIFSRIFQSRRDERSFFDPKFYLNAYPDVKNAGVDAYAHFADHGWREGRNPSASFHTLYYKDRNLGGRLFENPLTHYLRRAHDPDLRICPASEQDLIELQRRVIEPEFDRGFYAARYSTPVESALDHYLTIGWRSGFEPDRTFSTADYLRAHPHVAAANVSPFYHFISTRSQRRTTSSLFLLVREHLRATPIEVIFDVGANVGQSAREMHAEFPEAKIYAFEPVRSTFEMLRQNVGHIACVTLCNLALGKRSGEAEITNAPGALHNSVAKPGRSARASVDTVAISTGDRFCRQHNIEHIDYLKIDTEGLDLDVLLGFAEMLSAHAVGLVEVEASMNLRNRRHVPFEKMKALLESLDYSLFHIYEMASEAGFSGRPYMRRANFVFVSETMVEANCGPSEGA